MRAVVLAAALTASLPAAADEPEASCHDGAYRNDAGDVLVLHRDLEPGTLRFHLLDGRTGLLRPAPGGTFTAGPGWSEAAPVVARATPGPCGSGAVEFALDGGPGGTWRRIPLRVVDTTFDSEGARLAGRLVEPAEAGPWPVAITVHGSERFSAIRVYPWPWMLAAQGVAVFVYDKRGTGGSGGTYTMDFDLLARDAAAAVAEARRAAGTSAGRVGFLAGSQGGWVAPLAATRTRVDFLEIAFGMTGSPIDQDRWDVDDELRRRGYGAAVRRRGRALTTITAAIARSRFTKGLDRLAAFQARHRGEPWLREVEGQYTGALLRGELDSLRRENPGVPWDFDAMAVLRRLDVPQLWLLGGEDTVTPAGPTLRDLERLQRDGKRIEIVLFPRADHGLVEFVLAPDGSRRRTRRSGGLFAIQADWAKGRFSVRPTAAPRASRRRSRPRPCRSSRAGRRT